MHGQLIVHAWTSPCTLDEVEVENKVEVEVQVQVEVEGQVEVEVPTKLVPTQLVEIHEETFTPGFLQELRHLHLGRHV